MIRIHLPNLDVQVIDVKRFVFWLWVKQNKVNSEYENSIILASLAELNHSLYKKL